MNCDEKKIKEYLLSVDLSDKSANDIALELYVSRNKIYSVCKKMGYSSFTKLKYEMSNKKKFKNIQEHIEYRISQYDIYSFDAIINEIIESNIVYLIGTNATSIVCQYFYRQLINLGYNAVCITDDVLLQHYINIISTNDVIITFSNSGENKHLVKFLSDINVTKVAITKPDTTIHQLCELKIDVDTQVDSLDEGFDKEDIFSLILVVQTLLYRIRKSVHSKQKK